MLTRGQNLRGRFVVLRPLGRGGMGGVFLAQDQEQDLEVAIKELLLEELAPEQVEAAVRLFQNEARILRGLEHPNLPVVHDFFQEAGSYYLVMEYIQGRTLQGLMDSQGPHPEATVLAWAQELCAVLEYLHGQDPPIVFRDLKPANVMVDPLGHLKLIDFGIARSFRPQKGTVATSADQVAGTAGYAAPEQLGGEGDERTDIYSLGATLYALLTGATPPQSLNLAAGRVRLRDIRRFNPTVSKPTVQAVSAMMRPNPKDRPPTLAAVRALLPPPPSEAPEKPRSWSWILSATTVLALFLALGVSYWRGSLPAPLGTGSPGPSASASPRPGEPASGGTGGGRTGAPHAAASGAAGPSQGSLLPWMALPEPSAPTPAEESSAAPSGGEEVPGWREIPGAPGAGGGASPLAQGRGTIQPGVGLGGVYLGMSRSELALAFGPGRASRTSLGTAYKYADHRLTVFVQKGVVVAVMARTGRFSTAGGVRPGSPRSAVRAEFGSRHQVARHLPFQGRWEIYPGCGLAFSFRKDRVEAIMVASGTTLLEGR